MYVIQTAKDGKIWEQVDEYTFVNRKYALNNEGSPRYTNNWIKENEDGTYIFNCSISPVELSIVLRFLNATVYTGTMTNGFLRVPEAVYFKNQYKTFVRMSDGNIYVQKKEKKVDKSKSCDKVEVG